MGAGATEEHVVMFTDLFGFMMAMNSQGDSRYEFLQEIYHRLGECAVAAWR